MDLSFKTVFKRFIPKSVNLFQKGILPCLLACSFVCSVNANDKIFVQSNQGIKGFGGIATRPTDGKLITTGSPNFYRLFNPVTKIWEKILFTFPNYSFGDGVTNIPNGFAALGFLDGAVYSVLNDGTVITANLDPFTVAYNTGKYAEQYDPLLYGLDPGTYRASDDQLYVASSFVPTQIYKLDWRGSPLTTIPLTPIPPSGGYTFNDWQFGPGDLLYAPDDFNTQIVTINVDTNPAQVTTLIPTSRLNPLDSYVAVRLDNKGNLYFIGRRTGNVFKYVIATDQLSVIATLDAALDNFSLSLDQTKLYVTNDENKLVQVDVNTGATTTLFESPIVLPWDLAFVDNHLYVADFGSIKKFKPNGQLKRKFVLDTTTSGVAGIGSVSGFTVEPGSKGKIVCTDSTIGNVFVLNKDFTFYKSFNTSVPPFPNTGTGFAQPFSTVRIVSSTAPSGEYYLTGVTSVGPSTSPPVAGQIVKFMEDPTDPSGVSHTVFAANLWTPVKLKVYKDYLYVVEAGDLLNDPPQSPGRVSKIALNNPAEIIVLVDNLKNPQGLDIVDDQMYIIESGTKRLLQASALTPSAPQVLRENLELSNDIMIYPLGPTPINPPNTVAIEGKRKKHAYISQTEPNNILRAQIN